MIINKTIAAHDINPRASPVIIPRAVLRSEFILPSILKNGNFFDYFNVDPPQQLAKCPTEANKYMPIHCDNAEMCFFHPFILSGSA
jgi:hypothetical protein